MPLYSENAKNYYNFLRSKQQIVMTGKPMPEFQLVPETAHPVAANPSEHSGMVPMDGSNSACH